MVLFASRCACVSSAIYTSSNLSLSLSLTQDMLLKKCVSWLVGCSRIVTVADDVQFSVLCCVVCCVWQHIVIVVIGV